MGATFHSMMFLSLTTLVLLSADLAESGKELCGYAPQCIQHLIMFGHNPCNNGLCAEYCKFQQYDDGKCSGGGCCCTLYPCNRKHSASSAQEANKVNEQLE
ncbi:hypothetical protein EJB05_54623 [Eragrostis curvula]|uniref:Knottin scorpion toxin-like domain-containing protein n=1 Tax=Eragrostis curvula TaxID=38414 RepID=A0A5J9SM07_9POAL|nr:hypothetical protein EJB05_54623 [Eragrostis curvula]